MSAAIVILIYSVLDLFDIADEKHVEQNIGA